jgi:hypothetical protein
MGIQGFWRGNTRKRDHFENLGVDGREITKLIYKTSVETVWIRMAGLKYKEK